ncbi:MAG: double-strand break repair protein AddB, partial [Pseudomonadota bacterium]
MTANHLFAPDSPKLWTIPAGEPFLERLAQGLVDATGLAEKPDALADALIYVPNRRSATSLAKAFHKAVGRGLLLPSIRALGDTDPVEPFTGPAEATAALGPELRDAERLGALAAMVSKRLQPDGDRLPAVSAIAAARELADLLDQAALAGGVDWTRLPDLLADSDLAEHWSKSVEFLKIVSDDWPAWLKSRGALEPFARRIALAEAAAEDWRTAPPSGLVAIAGSTGATPASRTLMAAALNLPRGLVVLPGIDLEADAAVWTRLQEDPGHPQAAFAKTLSTLNARREEIGVWPIAGTSGSARRSLVHESLASVEDTGGWLDRIEALSKPRAVSEFTREALEGFSLIEAGSASDEASLAALLLRETLETPGKTAALITPDPTLSRRVSALLKRWDVHAPSGAGTPVLRSAEGSAIALILNWLKDPADPLSLASLLKHPLADFDDSDTVALEQDWLRGPRRWSDLNDLAEQSNSINVKVLSQARDECGLPELGDGVTGPAASEAMIVLASQVFGGSVWLGPGGRSAQSLLDDLATTTQGLGVIDINDLSALLNVLADGRTLPPHETPHPRLALLSPLEARLQSADRIILAGLNEGVWPAQPAPQAFLPRRFRKALGLDPLEARLGLSAHDFAQSACAPEVWALYSARRDDAPALASRWIWRLK